MTVFLLDAAGKHIGNVWVDSSHPSTSEVIPILEIASLAHPNGVESDFQTIVIKDAQVGTINMPGWTVMASGSTTFRGNIKCDRLVLADGIILINVHPQ